MRYEIRAFDERVRDAYQRLLPHQERANSLGKLEWKYLQTPAGPGRIVTAEADNTILGMIGAAAFDVQLGARQVTMLQAQDTVVSPEARGQGCFVKMGAVLQEQFPSIFGFPNANAARGWFGHLGWHNLGRAPFLFKPLRAGYFLRRVLPASIDFPLSFPRRSSAEVIQRFDERADRLWRNFAGDRMCAVIRSSDYLNWRLVDCPSATYDCIGVFEADRLRSFVATHTIEKHGGRIGYIMEAIGDETLGSLMSEAIARLAGDRVEAVLAWCFDHSPNRAVYRKAGFFSLPRRFAPEIHFGATQAPAPWYVSYLDSDTV